MIKRLDGIILVSLIIVGLTLFIPVSINEPNQVHDLRFGVPVPFVQQNHYLPLSPKLSFHKLYLQNPWETPTRVLWKNYFISVAIVSIILWTIVKIFTWIRNIRKLIWEV